MSLFSAIGVGLSLAVRYAPVALGIASKIYELIKNIRDDSNPVDSLGQSTLDDIQHIRDICGRIATLLGTSFPPLPEVSTPDDLTGFFVVATQYAVAYFGWADQNLATPAVQVRAALMPVADDFSGDEWRMGGISPASAASLTGNDLVAYNNLCGSLQSFIQVFPTRSMASRQAVPDYTSIDEYLPGNYTVLQRQCFAQNIETALEGLRELAVGGVIVPIDGFTTSTSYTWDLGTESSGGYLIPGVRASTASVVVAAPNQNYTVTFTNGGAKYVDNLIFQGQDPNDINFDTVALAAGMNFGDGTSWQYIFGMGGLTPTNTAFPPKFGLYHWMLPLKITLTTTQAVKGIAIRLGGTYADGANQSYTSKYYVDMSTFPAGTFIVYVTADMYWPVGPACQKAVTVLPCADPTLAVAANGCVITISPGTPYGVIDHTSLNASDVTYQSAATNSFVPITNDTRFFDLLGAISTDDVHDDPNASVSALFLQTFGDAAQAIARALGTYAAYASAYGVNVDARYQSVFGLHMRDLVDMESWLRADGPFAGLSTLQKRNLIFKLMYDLTTFAEYAPNSSGMSTASIAISEPVPDTALAAI